MKNRTDAAVAWFGAVAALAGAEHGVGEVLQGNVRPDSIMIKSWPTSPFFRILDGEPALTLIPNLLASGLLTIAVSALFLAWVLGFVHRRGGAAGLAVISVALLLVGGGFGPPLLGFILAAAATRIRSPHRWALRVPRLRAGLSALLPWVLGVGVATWLFLLGGVPLLDYAFGVDSAVLVITTFLAAITLLALSVVAGYARDAQLPAAAS